MPKDTIEEKIHYYNQTLVSNSSTNSAYVDEKDYGLNYNIETLYKAFNNSQITKDGNKYSLTNNPSSQVFTLSEVAYALYDENYKALKDKCNITNNERIVELKKLLSQEIDSVTAYGYASGHGYTELNDRLGKNRAKTASNWFVKTAKIDIKPTIGKNETQNEKDENEDAFNATKWRYTRVVVKFKSVTKSTPPTPNYEQISSQTPSEGTT